MQYDQILFSATPNTDKDKHFQRYSEEQSLRLLKEVTRQKRLMHKSSIPPLRNCSILQNKTSQHLSNYLVISTVSHIS